MSASNRATIQQLFSDGLNNHDVPVMMEFLSDCTFHIPLVGDLKGEALASFLLPYSLRFPTFIEP